MVAPERAPCTTPRSPRTTASTAAVSVTIVIVMSLAAAAAAADSARRAPIAMSGSIVSALRAHTVTVCPFFKRFPTIGAPIAPSPINPTRDVFIKERGRASSAPTILLFAEQGRPLQDSRLTTVDYRLIVR